MIYKQDLSLFSEEELLNLRTAITERLESYKGNALERENSRLNSTLSRSW